MQIDGLGSLDYASTVLEEKLEWKGRAVSREEGEIRAATKLLGKAAFTGRVIRPMEGSVGGSGKGSVDQDGNTKAEIEGHISYEDKDNGGKVSGGISASGKSDRDGNFSGEVKAEIKYERPF